MSALDIKATPVFKWNNNAFQDKDIRFIFNQGGTRSSKSISLCQLSIVYCLTNPGKVLTIVRKSMPFLRRTIMRDLFEVLMGLNLYIENQHNKSENIYTFPNGSMIEFFSVDGGQKLRGSKRDVLWCNEANELSFDDFQQLNMRTKDKCVFDFNPSDNNSWIYDVMSRDNAITIKSTYKDNPFLPKSQVKEIEELINVDENYYKIYALGERGLSTTTIYPNFKQYKTEPLTIKDRIYGLDFGYNHPTALIEVLIGDDNDIYCKEILYESRLTSKDLIQLFQELNVDKNIDIICDYARPEIIEELKRNHYRAKNAIKSVKAGIDSVKSSKIFIHEESTNLIDEMFKYKWKTHKEQILDEPVKIKDDAVDALRYAVHYYKEHHRRDLKDVYRLYY